MIIDCQKILFFADKPSLDLNLILRRSSIQPNTPNAIDVRKATHKYLFSKSPQRITLRKIELRIRVPPIVGVPCLVRCVSGPSFLTTCPTWISFILLINFGPRTKENKREVKVAKIALVDRNSTTLNGPKN